ncbi:MAG TPA: hypothetical protein VHE59_02675 [Mucilaginibacter sp.]|nr:hypothetical protein [Mucilaginibacter sp.]
MDQIKIFRRNLLLTIQNAAIIFFGFLICMWIGKVHLIQMFLFISALAVIFILLDLISHVSLINIDNEGKNVSVVFVKNFKKRELTVKSTDCSYSYKKEIGSRGAKLTKFRLYDQDTKIIIEIVPFASGWSEQKLGEITFLLDDIMVDKITQEE